MNISVLTATYSAAMHLPHLIESLRAQTDRDFEWIVVDGGSLDNTLTQLRGAGDVVSSGADARNGTIAQTCAVWRYRGLARVRKSKEHCHFP